MGKKVKIFSSDPILSKNYKYEKRIKERLVERAKNEEEKIVERQRRKEMMAVQSKVDAKIDRVTDNLEALAKTSKIDKLKSQMLQKGVKKTTSKVSSNIPELTFSTTEEKVDKYSFHFQMKVDRSELIFEKKKQQTQQIEEQTKK